MNYDKLIVNKNILITGGAGFVGSHLAQRLHRNGNKVFVLDNYFTGKKVTMLGESLIEKERPKIFIVYFIKQNHLIIFIILGSILELNKAMKIFS